MLSSNLKSRLLEKCFCLSFSESDKEIMQFSGPLYDWIILHNYITLVNVIFVMGFVWGYKGLSLGSFMDSFFNNHLSKPFVA